MAQIIQMATAPDPLKEARQLRLKLLDDGHLPQGILRQEIETSWRRCVSYGLNCLENAIVDSHQNLDLQQLMENNNLLIEAVAPELNYLIHQQGKGSLIILADAEANILAIEGQTELFIKQGFCDLKPGCSWSESLCGTNGVGTAVIERRAIIINRGEHYLDCLSQFSCVSVPIKGPQSQVMGVLNVTRDSIMADPQDIMSTLMLAVSNIESRIFAMHYPSHLLLAFHNQAQYLSSGWHGLLVLSLEGKLLAANESACALLNMTPQTLVGLHNSDLFVGGRSSELIARLLRGEVSRAQTAEGDFFFKALQFPHRTSFAVSMPNPSSPVIKPHLIEELAANNRRLSRALRMAHQGMAGGLPVLLQGETGTGKEFIAQALHRASTRAEKPFVAVNCAAIPEGLIESELFGYRDGAFTGSRRGGMIGRLQQAHGGTLFLDEIGDMPLALQARLLRVLQDRKVAPLGAGEELDINIALICATHRDLKRLVEEKLFREDLFYRVHGISVILPALREREDFDILIERLLAKLGASSVTLTNNLASLLKAYNWPGNIRQLEMVLRTALAIREPDEWQLSVDHLPDSLLDELSAVERPVSGSLRGNELVIIRQSLEAHQGNVSAAADSLGISRTTLYRKLRQLPD